MHVARYLTVDCILRSRESLDGLLSALKDNVFVLWNESSADGSFIGLETNLVNTNGPDDDICEFLNLFSSPLAQELIERCHERTLDVGFESGDGGDPLNVTLRQDTIEKVSELGFAIGLRIYPVPNESGGA